MLENRNRRLLLGPGPSIIHPRVLKAMSKPIIGHLDPDFIELMDEVKTMLKYLFQTDNRVTFAISGPGSAAMEMSLVNMLEPSEKVLVCSGGYFGERMKDMVRRNGSIPVSLNFDWGKPVDPDQVESILEKNPDIKYVTLVYAETSTGVQSNLKDLSRVIKKCEAFSIVDMVPALGGSEVRIDDWGIDVAYAGSQKCISCTPGVSPITFSERAIQRIFKRITPVTHWFYDLTLILNYWGNGENRSYHHTAPINALFGLHEALILIKEEGIEKRWCRHLETAGYAENKFQMIGLKYVVEKPYRMPQLHAVEVPSHVIDSEIRKTLIENFNIELGTGLGEQKGKIWRIGFMGEAAQTKYVDELVNALVDLKVAKTSQLETECKLGKYADAAISQIPPPN